jgi:tannase/feruloyl esterase
LAPGAWGTMGAEATTWPGIFLATSRGPSLGSVANEGVIGALLYGDPKRDMATVDLTQAARDMKRKLAPIINSDNPDLRTARDTGRKILQFHGWADPNIATQYSIDYFAAVQRFLKSDTKDFYRLFLVPGMAHCLGGVGPTGVGGLVPSYLPRDSEHDWVSALEAWVERGAAPEQIIGTEFKLARPLAPFATLPPGTSVKRTRPLCPYPQVAIYNGSGSTDDAASFRCGNPSS